MKDFVLHTNTIPGCLVPTRDEHTSTCLHPVFLGQDQEEKLWASLIIIFAHI